MPFVQLRSVLRALLLERVAVRGDPLLTSLCRSAHQVVRLHHLCVPRCDAGLSPATA